MNGIQTKSSFLQDTELFRGMYPAEIDRMCTLLQFGAASYHEGAVLIAEGSPIQRFGIVAAGTVRVSMAAASGGRLTLADVAQGSAFAECHAFLGTEESPIRAAALSGCSVFWFEAFLLRNPDFRSDVAFSRFCVNYMGFMARQSLAFNDRIQTLSRKTLREKLNAYFSREILRQRSRDIRIGMDRNELADYLGTDRSSLSRELARMKRDDLLDYEKNHFVIR